MPTKDIPEMGAPRRAWYENMPWWAKFILHFPNLSRWGLAFFPLILLTGSAPWTTWYLIPIGFVLSAAYIATAIRFVPAEDEEGHPNAAIFVVFGVRLPILFRSGYALIIPGGSNISSLILFQMKQIDRDLVFDRVRCRLVSIAEGDGFLERISSTLSKNETLDPKSGGEIDFNIGLTIQPKYSGWSLYELDEAGGIEEAISILTHMIGEDVRQVGRQLTWLEATFATDALSVKLIADVTNRYEYDGVQILRNLNQEQIRRYLSDARINGFTDTKGLGFLIRRVNVKGIQPRGKLNEAAEEGVVEELRRQGLIRNADAVADAVARLRIRKLDNDGSMSKKDLTDIVLINDKEARVSREIKDIRLSEPDKIANALYSVFAAKTGGNT